MTSTQGVLQRGLLKLAACLLDGLVHGPGGGLVGQVEGCHIALVGGVDVGPLLEHGLAKRARGHGFGQTTAWTKAWARAKIAANNGTKAKSGVGTETAWCITHGPRKRLCGRGTGQCHVRIMWNFNGRQPDSNDVTRQK